MKQEVRILIKHRRYGNYDFVLDSKYTIVRGNSGTGKTTLSRALAERSSKITVSGEYILLPLLDINIGDGDSIAAINSIYFSNAKRLANSLKIPFNENKIILYSDEDRDFNHNDFKFMMESPFLFIIITRNNLSGLPYGVKDVKYIRGDVDKTLYCPFLKYYGIENYDKHSNIIYDKLCVEDSRSGYKLFSKLCKSVYSPKGKDYMLNLLIKSNNTLFVADGAGFGSCICDFYTKLRPGGDITSNGLYLIDSFESMLLDSNFCQHVREKLHFTFLEPDIVCGNREKYYTQVFRELVKMADLGKAYTKSDLPECLDVDCCKAMKRTRCRYFMKGIKSELLITDELKYLLDKINMNAQNKQALAKNKNRIDTRFNMTGRFS